MIELKDLSPEEIVDGFVLPVELTPAEREEAVLQLAEARRQRASVVQSASQVRYARLLQIRFDLEDYLSRPEFDSERTFGYFLRRYVDIYPNNKQQLAEELGIHKSLLSQWLADSRVPSLPQLVRLEIHAQTLISAVSWLKLLTKQQAYDLEMNEALRVQERKNVKSQLEISVY